MFGFRDIEIIIGAFFSLFSVDSEGTRGGDDSIKDSLVFNGVPKDTMEENVREVLENMNNLYNAIISLFSVDSEGTGGGDDSIKDSLVFHGVPKDTMEENVGEDPEVMKGILDHTIRNTFIVCDFVYSMIS